MIADESAAHGCGLNSRKSFYSFDCFTKEEQAAISGSVSLKRQLNTDAEKMIGLESQIYVLELQKAPQKQSRYHIIEGIDSARLVHQP